MSTFRTLWATTLLCIAIAASETINNRPFPPRISRIPSMGKCYWKDVNCVSFPKRSAKGSLNYVDRGTDGSRSYENAAVPVMSDIEFILPTQRRPQTSDGSQSQRETNRADMLYQVLRDASSSSIVTPPKTPLSGSDFLYPFTSNSQRAAQDKYPFSWIKY